ncbi:MAG: M48 family metalloprotease [Alphaproteobacteria bacterium]|nr:M48 family metalloprotease [Alphaproteobacteria bacterium]
MSMNRFKTWILLGLLSGIFLSIGLAFGGLAGLLLAFVVTLGINLFSYWNADRHILGLYGAVEINETSFPSLYALTRRLTNEAGLPMPRLYQIEDPQPNAFATGRNPQRGAVAVTTGLLQLLDRDEVAAVISHELAHIENRDTLLMMVTAVLAGALSSILHFSFWFGSRRTRSEYGGLGLLLSFLVPVIAGIVQMAISRTREYAADRRGAQICGSPLSLASALRKISVNAERILNGRAEKNPATAHLFIINPLSGEGLNNIFSTHPPLSSRIDALEVIANEFRCAGHVPVDFGGSLPILPKDPGHHHGPWG